MRVWIWALLGLGACSVPSTLVVSEPELPPNADYVAVVAIKGTALVGSTGLARVVAGEPTFVVPRSTEEPDYYEIVTFSAESLRAANAPEDPSVLLAGHLQLSTPESPKLPEPVSRASYFTEGDRLRAGASGAMFEFRAPWQPECPTFFAASETVYVDISCAETACRAAVTQTGCRLDADLSICRYDRYSKRIDGRGTLHPIADVPLSPLFGECEQIEPRTPARISSTCLAPDGRTCSLDFYPTPPEPSLVVAEKDYYTGSADGGRGRPLRGRLNVMAVLSSTVVVGGPGMPGPSALCDPIDNKGELIAVDPETMEERLRVAGPPCMNGIAVDPLDPNRIIVSWREGVPFAGRNWVGRWDGNLRPIGAPVELISTDIPTSMRVHGISTSTVGPSIVLTISSALDGEAPRGGIAKIDPVNLTFQKFVGHAVDVDNGTFLPVASIVGERVISVDENYERIEAHGLDDLEPLARERVDLRSECSRTFGVAPAMMAFHRGTSRLVLPASDTAPTMMVLEWPLGTGCRTASFPFDDADGWTAITWPADDRLMLVTLGAIAVESSSLALFSPSELRFVTSAVSIGEGLTSFTQVDSRNRVWILRPGPGALTRVSAR